MIGNNYLVLLRSGNVIVKVLGQFQTLYKAKIFVEDNFSEFSQDICQYSKYQSELFITIEK